MNTRLKSVICLTMICGSLLLLAISCKKESDESETVTDADGNVYTSVKMGTQTWLVENLKTTKYNDGTTITNITDNVTWDNATTGAYCDYSNSPASSNTYGRLYNWYAVNTGKLCPTGWHVPSDAEWTTLIDYLGGESVAGGRLKEIGTTHWSSPNEGATNETGFTALPGGDRDNGGTFSNIGDGGFWWSSTEYDTGKAFYRHMYYYDSKVNRDYYLKESGFSVRCIKN